MRVAPIDKEVRGLKTGFSGYLVSIPKIASNNSFCVPASCHLLGFPKARNGISSILSGGILHQPGPAFCGGSLALCLLILRDTGERDVIVIILLVLGEADAHLFQRILLTVESLAESGRRIGEILEIPGLGSSQLFIHLRCRCILVATLANEIYNGIHKSIILSVAFLELLIIPIQYLLELLLGFAQSHSNGDHLKVCICHAVQGLGLNGGQGWIRTIVAYGDGFTVRSL